MLNDWIPWERQDGESHRDYVMFCHFLCSDQRVIPIHAVDIARDWCWVDRANEYDAHCELQKARIRVEMKLETEADILLRQRALAMRMQKLAEIEVEKLISAERETPAHGLVSPRDAARMAILGSKIEYEAIDRGPKKIDTVPDLSGLSAEDIATVSKIFAKLR